MRASGPGPSVPPVSSFCSLHFNHWLLAHSSNMSGILLPQGLCTGHSCCPECTSFSYPCLSPLLSNSFSISRLCMISSLIFLLKCTALPALPIPLSCFIFFHSAYHILTQSICFVFCLHSHISTLGQGLLLLLFLLFLFCSLLSWST